MGWYSSQKMGSLGQQLERLKPLMAQAAQKIYNEWIQDDDEMDPTLGGGGICDEISSSLMGVIYNNIQNVECTEGGQDGDDHSWVVVYNDQEAYGVDISPSVYEIGAGYSWKKIPNVIFDAQDIEIFPMNRSDFEFEGQ